MVVSTITKAGHSIAKRLFSDIATVIYFPLDFSFTVKRALRAIRPTLYIMVEAEIWPNLLKALHNSDVPSAVINGRISDKSFGKYLAARFFLKATLERIDLYCMQSDLDRARIMEMGAPKDKVMVTGSMKFDVDSGAKTPSKEMAAHLGLKPDDMLFVAGSTHPGEEAMVLGVYKGLMGEFQNLKLLIAPRHVERSAKVEAIIRKSGLEPVRFSKLRVTGYGLRVTDVLILDTIGHLNDAYSLATLVFIGGSMVRHGGQNPIEPAAFGKVSIFGPHMFNFKAIAAALLANFGAIQVETEKEMLDQARLLLENASARERFGENARRTVASNRGATARNLEAVEKIML
jgi:3-deoxy-D-manno-octulosonic-acid transferase